MKLTLVFPLFLCFLPNNHGHLLRNHTIMDACIALNNECKVLTRSVPRGFRFLANFSKFLMIFQNFQTPVAQNFTKFWQLVYLRKCAGNCPRMLNTSLKYSKKIFFGRVMDFCDRTSILGEYDTYMCHRHSTC